VGVAVRDAVGLKLNVLDPVPESELVDEELAPAVSVDVGVRVIDRERDKLALGVIEEDGVLVAVTDDVGLTLSLDVLVFDGVPELLGVEDALAPVERDDVGVAVIEDEREEVDEGVCEAVPEKDTVVEPVGVPDDDIEAVALTVDVGLDE
jgi:hypothetical protein